MPPTNTAERIDIHERLARIEEALGNIKKALDDQKDCDKDLDEKIDKILDNDRDKIKQIADNKASIKGLKAALYVFVVPLLYAVVRSFI